MTLTNVRSIGIAAFAGLVVSVLFQNVIGLEPGENGGAGAAAFSIVASTAIGAWLFMRVIPRAVAAGPEVAAKRGLWFGALGLLFVAVFWTGLPFVLGPAAIAVGLLARERGAGTAATVAIALGALAVTASTGITVMDHLS